jgi:hypothetical protein
MKIFTSSTASTLKEKRSSFCKDASSKLFAITMFLFLFSFTSIVQAQVTKTASTGNWNTPGAWSPSGVPASIDNVVIPAGVTVTGDVTTTVGSITFGNASASTATLSVNSGVVISVTNGVMIPVLVKKWLLYLT